MEAARPYPLEEDVASVVARRPVFTPSTHAWGKAADRPGGGRAGRRGGAPAALPQGTPYRGAAGWWGTARLAEGKRPPYGDTEASPPRPEPDRHPYAGPRVAGRSASEFDRRLRLLVPSEAERCDLTREERSHLARAVDDLLRKVVRGKDALGLRIGELLQWLDQGDRLITVGYHRVGDFAREECGLTAGDAQAYRRLAGALQSRPLLRAAVQAGEVSAVKAERVKQVARGEAEAAWVGAAAALTVRALTKAVRAAQATGAAAEGPWVAPVFPPAPHAPGSDGSADEASASAPAADGGTPSPEEDDPPIEGWTRLAVGATRSQLRLFDETVALARDALGADAPTGRCVEAMAQEVLAGATPPEAPRAGHGLPRPVPREGGGTGTDLRERLEEETARWAFLDHAIPTLSDGVPIRESTDPFAVREEVIHLSRLMRTWDLLVCRLAFLLTFYRLWRTLKFLNLHHYATERLGLSGRALSQRAWLERKMFEQPALREALEDRTLCYARALEVARADGKITIAWAASHSVVEICHRADEVEQEKMFEDRELRVPIPNDAWDTVDAALRAIQHAAERGGTLLDGAQAFWVMVAHAYGAWRPLARKKEPLRRHLEARKRALCEAYGCTMPGVDMHHVDLRAHGGPDGPVNRVLLCRPHHQRGAHGPGHTEIVALGNERFEWRFGCRPGQPPLRVVVTGGPPAPDDVPHD